jgi:hypothetical protein
MRLGANTCMSDSCASVHFERSPHDAGHDKSGQTRAHQGQDKPRLGHRNIVQGDGAHSRAVPVNSKTLLDEAQLLAFWQTQDIILHKPNGGWHVPKLFRMFTILELSTRCDMPAQGHVTPATIARRC